MEKRIRLTDPRHPRNRAAAKAEPYPGMVGQPDRKFQPDDKYENYVEVPGWETQELPTDIDDKRDEIGFPVMKKATVAKVRSAAQKAVRAAILFLGDKSPESVVEAQARDFMRLGNKGLDLALSRYQETAKFYAQKEEDDTVADDDFIEKKKEESEAKSPEEAKKNIENSNMPEALKEQALKKVDEEGKKKKKALQLIAEANALLSEDEEAQDEEEEACTKKSEDEEVKEEAQDEEEEACTKKSDDNQDEESDEDKDIGAKKSEDEEVKEEVQEEETEKKKSDDDDDDDDDKEEVVVEETVEAKKSGDAELDIEMSAADEGLEESPSEDKLLASLYEAQEEEPEKKEEAQEEEKEEAQDEEEPEKKKKAGVKKLGGQPRVASSGNPLDLSSLWNSAPDINELWDK